MSTLKPRINITVEPAMKKAILAAAEKDRMPIASKAHELLLLGLEIQEDVSLARIANDRLKRKVKFISHSKAWKTS